MMSHRHANLEVYLKRGFGGVGDDALIRVVLRTLRCLNNKTSGGVGWVWWVWLTFL